MTQARPQYHFRSTRYGDPHGEGRQPPRDPSGIRRAPRCPARYDQSHGMSTGPRFCIWGRDIKWMKAQIQKAINPPRRIRPDSKIAKFLPTTAMSPRSEYQNGRGFGRPLSNAEMNPPTYQPCWIASYCAWRPPALRVARKFARVALYWQTLIFQIGANFIRGRSM